MFISSRDDLIVGELLRVRRDDEIFWKNIGKGITVVLSKGDLFIFLRDEGIHGLRVLSSKFGIGNVAFVHIERA